MTQKKHWIITTVVLLAVLLYLLPKLLFLLNYANEGIPSYSCVTTKKVSSKILYQYIDTFLVKNPEFKDPTDSKSGYSHLRMASFYFKDKPEEMYEVSVSSFSCVRHFLKMQDGQIYYEIENPTREEKQRIKKRLEGIWAEIEKLVEESDLPDSVKYRPK